MAKYNESKRYTWLNDDRFEISGRDLGLFLNVFRAILNTEEAARIMLVQKANEAVESIIAEYVEKDVIKEAEQGETNG